MLSSTSTLEIQPSVLDEDKALLRMYTYELSEGFIYQTKSQARDVVKSYLRLLGADILYDPEFLAIFNLLGKLISTLDD
jgi:hypothetical protein